MGVELEEFSRLITPQQRAASLGQTGRVIWFTGLSGSGKSTAAFHLERHLLREGLFVSVLDGDTVRQGLCNDLDFTVDGRAENLRRIGHVAQIMAEANLIVLCAFVSPSEKGRHTVQKIVAPIPFDLVYVNTPVEICASRDPKGLYKKAKEGLIPNFTGVSSPYEVPKTPNVTLESNESTDQWVTRLLTELRLP
ncbi:MAG: adenylyl-sulfate kinase [Bradymonadia bacterium]